MEGSGTKRRLYIVRFDTKNNPISVQLSIGGTAGHGFKKWKEKYGVKYYEFVYVEAESDSLAKEKALEIIEQAKEE